jgi:HAMP domain-containing protein
MKKKLVRQRAPTILVANHHAGRERKIEQSPNWAFTGGKQAAGSLIARGGVSMKKLILAACVIALGVPAFGQVPKAVQSRPNVDYGMYGGPVTAPADNYATPREREPLLGLYGPYHLYGVPDDITAAEQRQADVRAAAVEFGQFRRQFTGSTQFWMDHHRTELAKSRFAMDEPMWRAVHPPEYFGHGGYLYNTAESVGAEVVWGAGQPVPTANTVPNTVPLTVPGTDEVIPVPTARARTSSTSRMIAGEKPIYDANSALGNQPNQ